MTVRVRISNDVTRTTIDVDSSATICEVIGIAEENDIPFTGLGVQLGDRALDPADMGKTLESFGYTGEDGHNRAFIMGTTRKNNA